MTRSREENAADLIHEEKLRQAADAEVAEDPALVPDVWMDYDEWLEFTGKDDSFVGNGSTVPGSADLYDAAIRALEAKSETPAP